MTEEIWCPIKGYEGLYEVSDQGRVKSIGYGKEIMLRPWRNTQGYLKVKLCKNGEEKTCYVHRIVAQTFTPNPENLPQVNHIDENPSNNKSENLEWCDQKYNNNYGTRVKRQAEKLSKSVLQYTKSGAFVREWKSTRDVERNLGFNHGNISQCCNGIRNSSNGYIWKFKD